MRSVFTGIGFSAFSRDPPRSSGKLGKGDSSGLAITFDFHSLDENKDDPESNADCGGPQKGEGGVP